MKKTLVALAAIASVAAFAQTTVSITGNLDFAGARFGGTMGGNKGTTVTTGNGTSSTSAINLIATEDIGGGTAITAFYGIDPRTMANDSTTSTNQVGSTSTSPNAVTVTGLLRHEAYVQASGGFGTVKLGAPNSIGLNVAGDSTPMGTSAGSGYAGHSNTQLNRVITTRYSRSLRYDTPVINGLTASALFAPGSDQAAVDLTSSSYGALQMPNARRVTEIGLKYSNGPLNASFVNISQAVQQYPTGYYSVSDTSSAAIFNVATKYNFAALNYTLGATTLYAGSGTGGGMNVSTTSVTNVKASRYGVKHTMGALDIMAGMTKTVSTAANATTSTTENVTGFQLVNNLSKTSAIYLAYEKWDTGATAVATNTTTGVRNITSIGLRKSF